MKEYKIDFTWDGEARVWIATSEDIRGLVLEHGSLDVLMERVKLAVPDLLTEEELVADSVSMLYQTTRMERIVLHG